MACGLPVAVRWDPGYRGAVAEGVLASASDLRSLADLTRCLARDAEARRRVGERASRYAAERYSWSAAVGRYLEIFGAILEERKGA
jgi:glycosyltransferase involved in cell wall biosynthesis